MKNNASSNTISIDTAYLASHRLFTAPSVAEFFSGLGATVAIEDMGGTVAKVVATIAGANYIVFLPYTL